MSDLHKLHLIINTLPPSQIQALLTLLEKPEPVSNEQFGLRLVQAGTQAGTEEDYDAETIARLLAAQAEPGEDISHAEMRNRLGL